MSRRSLTEGSRRAVLLAERQAIQWGHSQIQPAHLLWALLAEESHAFELLEGAGVTRQAVEQGEIWERSPPKVHGHSTAGQEHSIDPGTDDRSIAELAEALTADVAAVFEQANGASPRSGNSLVESDLLQQVHQHAQLAARREGRDIETSSIHLLSAMLEVDRSISAFLFQFGISTESFRPVSQSDGTLAEPMPVSFEIDQQGETPGERAAVLRILDASANRAREGLRVVEDFVRFSLDDAYLSELLKSARHQLRSVMQGFDVDSLISSRSTTADVGTQISTASELVRSDSLSVARASLKRVQEAVRTLEEYSKVGSVVRGMSNSSSDPVPASQQFEQIRYELYSVEKAILTTFASQRQFDGRHVYLLLSSNQCRGEVLEVLRDAIAGGVRIVQIREKSMPDRELLEYARAVRRITRESGTLLIVNDRPDIAALCEADGVHVGQEELSVHDVRRIVGPDCLIGVSTHSIDQARRAVLEGAGCIGVGPVFPSGTKSFSEFAGLDLVREVAAEIQLPWFPIGGIDQSNVDEVIGAGATRVAVSGAVCRAENPRQAVERLVARLANH